MPVIQSAKKQMRQSLKKRERNTPVRTELKSVFKKMLQLIKDGKVEEAEKFMTKAYSVIDTAAKKNLIHKNNAARKKSRLARSLATIKTK
ncbi:MAG: 30S ribosomal protein S20 [Candidatus Roizmanbacteria bacterium]|nr:30S ribosomal protein S20 [Candidatus Roizmanbacteria bacterium]